MQTKKALINDHLHVSKYPSGKKKSFQMPWLCETIESKLFKEILIVRKMP